MNKAIVIRPMVTSDLGFAQQLRLCAGWNQTTNDWTRLLNLEPDGCFLALWEGRPAGTATAICYGADVGWIGMVLVHPELRRRGVATALVQNCVTYLAERVRCIKLDATPDGKKVYERLGFQVEWALTRWQRTAPPAPGHTVVGTPIHAQDWPEIAVRDAAIFGANRTPLLRLLAHDSEVTWVTKQGDGTIGSYGMARAGVHAGYIGPVISLQGQFERHMIQWLMQHLCQEVVYWDIPDGNVAAVNLAQRLKFSRQRPLLRMWMGDQLVASVADRQWAIAGPAIG